MILFFLASPGRLILVTGRHEDISSVLQMVSNRDSVIVLEVIFPGSEMHDVIRPLGVRATMAGGDFP